jgi:branched-chain amino acid transport system ATP-binding protein
MRAGKTVELHSFLALREALGLRLRQVKGVKATQAISFLRLLKLLLVDEPTIGLAPLVCLEIARVLADLKTEQGITILITEQNVNFTLTLAEEIYLLETGRIKMKGMPEELKQEKYIQETYFGV